MLFTLEALNARHGDALLLHYGPSQEKARLIVIDGGPARVYDEVLSERLKELREARGPDNPLKIRLLMVSHIDDDHIHGVLELAKTLDEAEATGTNPPWDVLSLWHNSFDDLVKPVKPSDLAAGGGTASAADLAAASPDSYGRPESKAIAASVPQGRTLRQIAERLAWNVNHGFDDLVFLPAKGSKVNSGSPVKKMDKGLDFVVVGPLQAQLDALQTEWAKQVAALKKRKKTLTPAEAAAEVAAYLDESVANLSSIVVLARSGGRTMLLTGDARGDHILDGLKAAKLMKQGKLHVDVLKVPHHGSARNVEEAFFRAVTADHYVISADGKHDNPDPPMLDMLVKARGKVPYTIHLTNSVPHAVRRLKALQKGRKFKLVVRTPSALSVRIDLGEPFQA